MAIITSTLIKDALLALFLISPIAQTNARTLGDLHYHLHHHAKRAASVPTNLPPPWQYKGCYTDDMGSRTLKGPVYFSGTSMTASTCINSCNSQGYVFAGTEYAGECFCGNQIAAGATVRPDSECNMACSGDPDEACGGPNRLTLFSSGGTPPPGPVTNPGPPGWTSRGCYSDNIGGRTLTVGMPTTGGGGALTVEKCTTACRSGNFNYAGVEYGGECYCGNTLSNGGALVSSGCDMVCNGNSTEYCGGPNRLNLYGREGTGTTDTITSTTATATSTSSSAVATATGLPTGWSSKGCWVDNANGRILINQQPDDPQLTVSSCSQKCFGLGYSIAGLEYSTQCFCDSFLRNGAEPAPDSDCGMPCGGNVNEKCGGPNRMNLYSNGTLQEYQPPVPQKTDLPGSWAYQGCLTDAAATRTFPYQLILKDNTPKNCLTRCSDFGYGAGGMEYGEECFCGDPIDVTKNGATLRPESECNMPCPGNGTYLCGAGNRLSYYLWNSTALDRWSFATGNAAGRYEFLIGGPVIPLITTIGINGKVTFVEKFGTSPANNGTGAYELDVTQINDFSKAWRTMNVKTDVFCAAGLVLPDKAGRQINIGGWANDATYGVRLYTPDGGPGQPSTNDWEENVNELSLQQGRWYPTAMIMANGSVLVVGGQVGANGAPVPTLEILPKPAGGSVVYCDYLERTDPYNLYPYLAVLPSGGIFIAYYNEARILDERTFATTKELPKIPAAVNNPAGGRSYPMEGTAMLMPQYAPYNDPLTILICGGSVPGPEVALDNCVSIAPEVPDAKWTLERMPTKRVIPCMVALPDGTYLILNGAKHGFAGFGLAKDPNLAAIQYDPSKPAHERMTVLANTTVARMYHSEALLLQDGRVLVSGSDPQDPEFPQEYRVEVFLPPYLTSGAPRPAFTIANRDWAYGQAVPLTVTRGSTARVRVSLLGAESSTHGNTMGQRTLFPAVSCAGAVCTVEAPPDAHVCPPGWYQLFVLDGPTPSHSQWVRIGGDPARLGEWPKSPSFKPPGM